MSKFVVLPCFFVQLKQFISVGSLLAARWVVGVGFQRKNQEKASLNAQSSNKSYDNNFYLFQLYKMVILCIDNNIVAKVNN